MRQLFASHIFGSLLVASAASAQSGYGSSPAPATTYTPAPVQPTPGAPPQYAQPAPAEGAPTTPQPAQPQPQMQPAPQPQYAPAQPPPQPQPQYQQQPSQQPAPQSAYGQPSYAGGVPPPEMGPQTQLAPPKRVKDMHVAIGIERAFGVYSWSATADPGAGLPSIDDSGTMVSLLYGTSTTGDDQDAVNPSAVPHFAIDGIFNGATVGGSVGFASTSGKHEVPNNPSQDYPDRSSFAIAVRAGYLASVSDSVSFWPRGGIERFSTTRDRTTTETIGFTMLALEVPLVITPSPHVGIQIAPMAMISLSGSREFKDTDGTTSDTDLKLTTFGLTAGLTGFL